MLLADGHLPVEADDALAAPVTPDEVGALLSLIGTINAGIAVGVRTCGWLSGSYQR